MPIADDADVTSLAWGMSEPAAREVSIGIMSRLAGCFAAITMVLVACAAPPPAKTANAEPPPRPYPGALAQKVRDLLPFCHAGSVDACEELGHALVAAGYWREGGSAYAFACYAPATALMATECKAQVDGTCASCECAGKEACKPDASVCNDPEMKDYLCGDGTYARCVQRRQLVACSRASTRLHSWALKHADVGDDTCTDRWMQVQETSLTFADQVCNANVDPNLDARYRRFDNHQDDRCEQREVRAAQLRECADYRRFMAAAEARMAQSRAQFQRDFARAFVAGVGDVAGTMRQVKAAERGEIVAHQRVELPNVDPTKLPLTKEELGAALAEHAPDILRQIARLHPEGERIFDESTRALAKLREVEGVLANVKR